MSRRLALLAMAALVGSSSQALAEVPWSIDPRHPTVAPPGSKPPGTPPRDRDAPASAPQVVAEALLWAWTHGISRVDGATCPFYPTCSGFARQAVERHGFLLGSIMAADRIMRNHADRTSYELVVRRRHLNKYAQLVSHAIARLKRAHGTVASVYPEEYGVI